LAVSQTESLSRPAAGRLDRLGVVIAALVLGAGFLPFAVFRPNRIAPGQGKLLFDALPLDTALPVAGMALAAALVALLRCPAGWRLLASFCGLAAAAVGVGLAATHLTAAENPYARVSPGAGFWLALFAFTLLSTDSLVRLNARPLMRLALLAGAALLLWLLLASGLWDQISFMKEYRSRADTFWTEAGRHVTLALGSLAAAILVGVPLGLLCHRLPRLRNAVLNGLNIVQTVPSMALFGLLIAPLGWLAAHAPFLAALGLSGIGAAPAFVALFLYSLLPIVANTVAGLAGVPAPVTDAARGMGMTRLQRLAQTEFPLAFPVILTGVRIVMVQNIGLTTIAALIGGGGFGTFVFQGVGQTAMDLVLLGALPTVLLAFAAAVTLDAAIELSRKGMAA